MEMRAVGPAFLLCLAVMEIINVLSSKKREVIDLTDGVNDLIARLGVENGACHLFVQHTTAALTVGEMEEGAVQDLLEFVEKIIPDMQFRHTHKPNHASDHMIGALIGPSLTIPIVDGKLALGTWQRIMLIELDGPRERTITATFIT
jgi:secondary thiamine-phosphate synthase enzyme